MPDPAPNLPPRSTQLAHTFLAAHLRHGDLAIDATAGNGHDTAFLAGAVGPTGHVIAIDLQAAALEATRARLAAASWLDRVTLVEASHATLARHAAPSSTAAVVFNLGYLPGSPHALITTPAETLAGLDATATVLKPGGLLTVVAYPGHAGGDTEASAVLEWFESRTALGWRVARYGLLGTRKPAPFLLTGTRPDGNASPPEK